MKRSVVLLSAALLGLAPGCGRPSPPPGTGGDALATVGVHTVRVEDTTVTRLQPVIGTVRPVDRALVAARIMGTIETAEFAVGQAVRAGDVLITLSVGELAARVEQARAALSQATSDHAREAALLAKGASTADMVRSLEDRRRIASAALVEAETMLGYARVAAPFDGIVTRDLVNPGDFAAPGAPLFEIEGTKRFRAEVQVPESLSALPLGAEIAVEWEGGRTTGRLAEHSPAADSPSRTRLAKIDLPAGVAARSGQFVRAWWPAGQARRLTVPADAVTLFGQMERVFVVVDGRAQLRLVKTGAIDGDGVQILSGLNAGERVVVEPAVNLRDGQTVEVLP